MKVKLTFNDGKKTVTIPKNWHEVKYKDFVQLVKIQSGEMPIKEEIKQIVALIYNLSEDEINSIDFDQVLKLFMLIDFVKSFNDVLQQTAVPEIYKDFDVGSHEWSKLIEAMIYIKPVIEKYKDEKDISDHQKNEFLIEVLTQAPGYCKPYLNFDISEKPVMEVYWAVNFFLQKLVSFSMKLEDSKLKKKKRKTNTKGLEY